MAIQEVNPLEEFIDILVDDHPQLLIAITVLVIAILGLGFHYYFWPIIDGQPEYFAQPVLRAPTINYEVSMALPKRVDPSREEKCELTMHIRQAHPLSATQVITSSIRSLSPFLIITSTNISTFESVKSFEVAPQKVEPQEFVHTVYVAVTRPANHPKTLSIKVSLEYENVRYNQEIPLQIDYWSRMIVYFVSSGVISGIVTLAVTLAKSLSGR